MTGRPHVQCDIDAGHGRAPIFTSIGPTEDDVLQYPCARLRKDTMQGVMNSPLEPNIMKIIPETSAEMYVGIMKELPEGEF